MKEKTVKEKVVDERREIEPGITMGSGVTVRLLTCNRSEPGPQFDHEKPKIGDDFYKKNELLNRKKIHRQSYEFWPRSSVKSVCSCK